MRTEKENLEKEFNADLCGNAQILKMKNKNYSQQRQLTEVSKGLCSRNPLIFRDKDNRKELLTEINSHEDCLCFADIFKTSHNISFVIPFTSFTTSEFLNGNSTKPLIQRLHPNLKNG